MYMFKNNLSHESLIKQKFPDLQYSICTHHFMHTADLIPNANKQDELTILYCTDLDVPNAVQWKNSSLASKGKRNGLDVVSW